MNEIGCLHSIIATQELPGFGNILFGILPLVIGILCVRKLIAMKARLRSTGAEIPVERPHQHSALARFYFRLIARLHLATVGRFANYHERHVAYLSSGQSCQKCGATLLDRAWMPMARCIDASGTPIPLTEASKKGSEFECPHCHHRWPLRKAV